MDFPKEQRLKVPSKDVLKRLDDEIKQRSDVVGTFPNERVIRRLVGALLPLEEDNKYAIQRAK